MALDAAALALCAKELSAALADMEQVWSKYGIFGKEDDD